MQIERGFDIPVAFAGMPEELVITRKSTEEINIRVLGPRAALRDISAKDLEYAVNLEGAKPGKAVYLVDETTLVMPQGMPMRIWGFFQREMRLVFRTKASIIFWVISKSAMTPSFMGLTAMMLLGVWPIML